MFFYQYLYLRKVRNDIKRITTGSRIQVENNFSENKCIVIFLTYLLILEQLLIEKRPLGHYKLEEKLTISSAD